MRNSADADLLLRRLCNRNDNAEWDVSVEPARSATTRGNTTPDGQYSNNLNALCAQRFHLDDVIKYFQANVLGHVRFFINSYNGAPTT